MLNIFTLKVGNKYSAAYVNNLYRSLLKHSTMPFQFYCMTDDPTGLKYDGFFTVIPLPDNPKVEKQWFKLYFHDMSQFHDQRCLILDIDFLIIKNIDDILAWDLPKKHFGCNKRWWSARAHECGMSGGFQMFWQGDTWHLLHAFLQQPEYYQKKYINLGLAAGPVNGEQFFIDEFCGLKRDWLPENWFAKYDKELVPFINQLWHMKGEKDDYYQFEGKFSPEIKMVHFADAKNMIHEYDEPWIQKAWTNE